MFYPFCTLFHFPFRSSVRFLGPLFQNAHHWIGFHQDFQWQVWFLPPNLQEVNRRLNLLQTFVIGILDGVQSIAQSREVQAERVLVPNQAKEPYDLE